MTNKQYFSDFYKTLRVLCVEDDPDVLEVYKALFSMMFQEVIFATNGKEGLEKFEKEHIDLVITDQNMPVMSGLEMAKELRKEDATLPIVMITAFENIEILREALLINITGFLQKPFTNKSLQSVFSTAVKSIIADRYAIKAQKNALEYATYQEQATYKKELQIIKNDTLNNQFMHDFTIETAFYPRDILSGDSYSVRKIDEEGHLLFLVDGMGKGVSASATAMLSNSFVNYFVNSKEKKEERFELTVLIQALLLYIQPNLLEDEILSFHAICFTPKSMEYCSFAMPPLLVQKKQQALKVRANNPPCTSYTKDFETTTLLLEGIEKILIYSDGLNENTLKNQNDSYESVLQNAFIQTQTVQSLYEDFKQNTAEQEDDVTLIYLKKEL